MSVPVCAGSLKEQMERLPVLARLQFETIAQFLKTQFDQMLALYDQGLVAFAPGNQAQAQQLLIVEGRLTWLVNMVSAVMGSQLSPGDGRKSRGDQAWDGQLARCCFQLLHTIEARLAASGGLAKCDVKLEMAVLSFLKSFKRSYLMDGSGSSSGGMSSMGIVPGIGSVPHPLLAFALGDSGRDEDSGGPGASGLTPVTEPCRSNFIIIIIVVIGIP